MERGFDELSVFVDNGHTAALHGAEHNVGAHTAVEIGLAVDLVAKIIAFGGMFANVFQCPGAGNNGLDTEDVRFVAIDFGLNHSGDVGFELHIVDE